MTTPRNVFGITKERFQELFEGTVEDRREASEEIWGELCRQNDFISRLQRFYYAFIGFKMPSEGPGDRTPEEHEGWLQYLRDSNIGMTEENK
jgi:hypothetical protein